MAMAKLEESGNIPADVNVIATNSTPASAGPAAKRQSAKVPKILKVQDRAAEARARRDQQEKQRKAKLLNQQKRKAESYARAMAEAVVVAEAEEEKERARRSRIPIRKERKTRAVERIFASESESTKRDETAIKGADKEKEGNGEVELRQKEEEERGDVRKLYDSKQEDGEFQGSKKEVRRGSAWPIGGCGSPKIHSSTTGGASPTKIEIGTETKESSLRALDSVKKP